MPVWSRADEPLGPGGVTTLIGSEIDELDTFVARVLPRTVLALAVPALLLAWIGHLDRLEPPWPARPVLLLGEPTRHLDAATADAVLHAVFTTSARTC